MNATQTDPPPLIVEWSQLLQLREVQPPGEPDVVLELAMTSLFSGLLSP